MDGRLATLEHRRRGRSISVIFPPFHLPSHIHVSIDKSTSTTTSCGPHEPLARPPDDEMREHRNDYLGKRRLFFARAMIRQNKGRLPVPSRMMFSRWKNPGPGGPPNNWLKTLRDDLAVFQSTEGSTQESPRQFGVEIYRSMQQIRRASGTGGSSKQPNDSRPGVT